MGEDDRYRRAPWTPGGAIGCLVWPVVTFLLLDPMMRLILPPCFFEEGCGWLDVAGLPSVLIAAMLGAVLVSNLVRVAVNIVFGSRTI